jgi:hypothetical protein
LWRETPNASYRSSVAEHRPDKTEDVSSNLTDSTIQREIDMQDLWIEKTINKNITKKLYRYYELGLLGCGKESKPFLDMSEIVQLPENKDEIIKELFENLEVSTLFNKAGGLFPKELNDGKNIVSYYYYFIEQFFDQSTLDQFETEKEFDSFVYEKFKCKIWPNILAPRISDSWYNKSSNDNSMWTNAHNVPKFKEWVETLRKNIFDDIGRIIVFNSQIDEPIMTHRDFHFREHSCHFINFQFSGKTNIAYVYDEVTKEKIYIDTPCYMFNECDLHGVDSCEESRFTVRIDGTFKPHISKHFNLINGKVWDSNSNSYSKIKNIKIIEPIFEG